MSRRLPTISLVVAVVALLPAAERWPARAAPDMHRSPGSVPLHCSPGPEARFLSKDVGPGVGFYPVWALGISDQPATLACNHDCVRTPHGWGHKNLWVLHPRFHGRVVVRGGEVHGRAPLWLGAMVGAFAAQDEDEVRLLVLDSRWRYRTRVNQPSSWTVFPGGITVPKSGRYYLEARYPGGHWCFTFDAGV